MEHVGLMDLSESGPAGDQFHDTNTAQRGWSFQRFLDRFLPNPLKSLVRSGGLEPPPSFDDKHLKP